MRSITFSLLAISACGGSARPTVADFRPPASALAAPARVDPPGLRVEELTSPTSQASVRILSPRVGESVKESDALGYELRFEGEHLDPDMLGIDLALDAHRPRRVPASQSAFSLGQLVPADESLSAGEHWLFAAPVSALDLVPRRAPGLARSATATRFWIGEVGANTAQSGVVWLRSPSGTYNGASADRVLFDAQVFAGDGAALPASCALRIQGPSGAEQTQTSAPTPFSVLALESGEYAVTVLLPGIAPVAVRFTVNRELGGPK